MHPGRSSGPPALTSYPRPSGSALKMATALLRGPDRPLTQTGRGLHLGVRLLGPTLLGLVVLSIRDGSNAELIIRFGSSAVFGGGASVAGLGMAAGRRGLPGRTMGYLGSFVGPAAYASRRSANPFGRLKARVWPPSIVVTALGGSAAAASAGSKVKGRANVGGAGPSSARTHQRT